jgi:HK97 family phage major capsid protein
VEGEAIPETVGAFDEVVITTDKIAALGKFSREALSQPKAAQLIVASLQASVIAKADRAFLSNTASPNGLLTIADIEDGGDVGDNLDTLADAVTLIEADGGTASGIIAAPGAWGALSKLKSVTGSATNLLGAGTEAAERRLLGIPVLSTAAMPVDTILVVDASTILTVYGDVQVARSDDAFFTSDVAGIRVTFRCGWGVMRPQRISTA